jgi:hypothetical protein
MHRTTMLPENWWDLAAEAWTENAAGQEVVALRRENDQLRRALSGRMVIDQACGMVMVLAPCRRGPAGNLLVDMSRQRNTKLPEVAAAVVAFGPAAAHQQDRAGRSTTRDPSVIPRARAAVCGHRLGDGVRSPGREGVRSCR